MNNVNTLSKLEYLAVNIFYSIVSMIWFKNILFRCVWSLTRSASLAVLWAIFLFSITLGVIITWNHRRNILSLITNLSLPFGVYILISYIKSIPIWWYVIISVSLLLSIMYTLIILFHRIATKRNRKKIFKKRISHCLLGTRTLVSVSFAAIILSLSINILFRGSIFTASTEPEIPTKDNKWTISNNIETVLNLREEVWKSLSTKAKLDTMQTVANIEATYLGLPHELNVTLGVLDKTTVALYSDPEHIIILNIDFFDSYSASNALNSLCHEAYHAFQHRLCDAYDTVDKPYQNLLAFRNVEYYKYEFSDYISGNDDFLTYYRQKCETDSRSYATSAVNSYYKYINNHSSETEE